MPSREGPRHPLQTLEISPACNRLLAEKAIVPADSVKKSLLCTAILLKKFWDSRSELLKVKLGISR
jgi:hypothetical protein